MNKFYLVRAKLPAKKWRWYSHKETWVSTITEATKHTSKMQAILTAQDLALNHEEVEVNQFERTIVWRSNHVCR